MVVSGHVPQPPVIPSPWLVFGRLHLLYSMTSETIEGSAIWSPGYPAEDGLHRATSKAQEKSSVPVIVSLSIVVVSCISVLGFAVIFYLFIIRSIWLEGTVLVSTARLQLITAITQALSTCITRVTPIVISIYAYSTAAEWLVLSQQPDSPERPTALQ